MNANPLRRLAELDQSVWYDYIRRDLVEGGGLQRLIEGDGLAGMTSNPTIFQKAIAETELYDEDVRAHASRGLEPAAVFEALAVEDVRNAADVFRPLHEASGGEHGFVSIEVGPHLARDTQRTIEEARRLWKACDRPNVMVKIPGTAQGLPAIRQCLSEGIHINITLLFSVPRYREVMAQYFAALEERAGRGEPLGRIRSVASFFVSRVDTNVDKKLDAHAKDASRPEADRKLARELRGKLAIANARIAYQAFEETFRGPRWEALSAKGAAIQRPLWASTSTKDPAYPELYYVEALVAPRSVDTMPPETYEAYRERGEPKIRIREDLDGAQAAFRGLQRLGIDEQQVSRELEDEGVRKFADSYDQLLEAIGSKERALGVGRR